MLVKITPCKVMRSCGQLAGDFFAGSTDYKKAAKEMKAFMEEKYIEPDSVLYEPGDQSDCIFIIESGSVLCEINFMQMGGSSRLPPLRKKLAARPTNRYTTVLGPAL